MGGNSGTETPVSTQLKLLESTRRNKPESIFKVYTAKRSVIFADTKFRHCARSKLVVRALNRIEVTFH